MPSPQDTTVLFQRIDKAIEKNNTKLLIAHLLLHSYGDEVLYEALEKIRKSPYADSKSWKELKQSVKAKIHPGYFSLVSYQPRNLLSQRKKYSIINEGPVGTLPVGRLPTTPEVLASMLYCEKGIDGKKLADILEQIYKTTPEVRPVLDRAALLGLRGMNPDALFFKKPLKIIVGRGKDLEEVVGYLDSKAVGLDGGKGAVYACFNGDLLETASTIIHELSHVVDRKKLFYYRSEDNTILRSLVVAMEAELQKSGVEPNYINNTLAASMSDHYVMTNTIPGELFARYFEIAAAKLLPKLQQLYPDYHLYMTKTVVPFLRLQLQHLKIERWINNTCIDEPYTLKELANLKNFVEQEVVSPIEKKELLDFLRMHEGGIDTQQSSSINSDGERYKPQSANQNTFIELASSLWTHLRAFLLEKVVEAFCISFTIMVMCTGIVATSYIPILQPFLALRVAISWAIGMVVGIPVTLSIATWAFMPQNSATTQKSEPDIPLKNTQRIPHLIDLRSATLVAAKEEAHGAFLI